MTIQVVHVITGLGIGGAEMVMLRTAIASRGLGVQPTVICLGARGPVSEMLEQESIVVHHVGTGSVWQFPSALSQARSVLRDLKPDLIQGWMYHGNLAAIISSRGTDVPVVWNIRTALHRVDLFKMTTRMAISANAKLSCCADSIIYNSKIARLQHETIGFRSAFGTYIPNGVDLQRFSSDGRCRDRARKELGIADHETVIISVGRVHPIKGHEVLMRTIRSVIRKNTAVKFLVVGRGATWNSEPFSGFSSNIAVRKQTLLLGERTDVADLLASADIFLSTSHTEGFPNAIAEAMASKLPCVVTDVGDSRLLLGDFGDVVIAGDADAIVHALLDMMLWSFEKRRAIVDGARARIEREYSLPIVAQKYADLYHKLVCDTDQEPLN